jgi:antitoxin MazE
MYILMFMKTTISKWGNSLAVRIPVQLAEELSISSGDDMTVNIKDKKLILSPVIRKMPSLQDILKGFDRKHKSDEDIWGEPMGKEVW